MKIRCEQNSIRLRLRKSELVQLKAEQWLETVLHFPEGQAFTWELLIDEQAAEVSVRLRGPKISIKVPLSIARPWMDTEAVGMEFYSPLPSGSALHVLVEKDFPCKDQPEEDRGDFFTELAEDAPANC